MQFPKPKSHVVATTTKVMYPAVQAADTVDAATLASRPWLKFYDPGVPADLPPTNLTLGAMLRSTAEKFPNRAVSIFFNNHLTYAELDKAADSFANGLRDIGVKPGDRVALLLPNCPQFLIAYYGASRAGAIVVPCNPLYVERELAQQLNNSGATVLVTLTAFYKTVRAVKPKTQLRRVIVSNIKDYFPPQLKVLFTALKEKKEGHRADFSGHGVYNWLDFLAAYPAIAPEVKTTPDDVAVYQYTGGTTGTPKAALLTHRNLITNSMMGQVWTPGHAPGTDIFMAVIPFFHVYGMTCIMNLSVLTGATIILLPRFNVVDTLKAIDRHKPTMFPGAPALYIALLNSPQLANYNLSSIKACMSGASPLPAEVQAKFQNITGAKLVEGFGMTESAPMTHANPLGHVVNSSIGVPMPGVDAKIVDLETGTQTMPIGEIGELVVKSATVMQSYYNRPEETAQTIRDGWLYTGDIARQDDNGFFYIVDRKKDMILSNGYNVYPRDVEEVLFQHPAVKEAVVIGAPNVRGDTTVKAFIVLKEGETATEEEIIAFGRENLTRYKAPRLVEFRDALPKTMIGKPLRRVLVEEEQRKLTGASEPATPAAPTPTPSKRLKFSPPKLPRLAFKRPALRFNRQTS